MESLPANECVKPQNLKKKGRASNYKLIGLIKRGIFNPRWLIW